MKNNTYWQHKSITDIVNHITKSHHNRFQEEMPDISMLTSTILRVHGQDHKELSRVHRMFHIVQINLVQHIIKQEANIFPAIKYYDRKPSKKLLKEILYNINELEIMEKETENLLKDLREITNSYIAPEDGCPTYEKTYEKLKNLEENILNHNYLERDLLFSRLKSMTNIHM